MNKIIIVCIAVLLQVCAFSQSSFELKTADSYFKTGEYFNAIVNYEIYLGIRKPVLSFTPYGQKNNVIFSKSDSAARADAIIRESKKVTPHIAFRLAESYRSLNHFQKAEKCYARLLQTHDTTYPFARFWYAVCLRCNNKFDAAKYQFNSFINNNSGSDEMGSMARKELVTLNYIKQQFENDNRKLFTLKKLRGNIAQAEGAYSPILLHDTIIFTSARIVDTVNRFSKVNQHVNHLFYNTIVGEDSISGKASMLRFPSRLSINEATPTITPDRKMLYFSRSNTENVITSFSIFKSERVNDTTWSEPEKVAKVNKVGYNSIQPSVTRDGKYLLFASDRDGGAGGFDIWCSQLNAEGTPAEPFNLAGINTNEDEEAPFYHSISKTLVFASKGYQGMGGFDLYAAIGDIMSLQNPINMGTPINSPKDDIYFFSTSQDSLLKSAFISSDRASDCCLEIFSLSKLFIPKKYRHNLIGIVSDCERPNPPIYDANVIVNKTTTITTTNTNNSGYFYVANGDSVNQVTVSKQGYASVIQQISFPKTVSNHDVNDTISICLKKLVAVKDHKTKTIQEEIDSINSSIKPMIVYFDFDKSIIRKDAVLILNELVSILKEYPTLMSELTVNGHTDAMGSVVYNLKLGDSRANSVKKYVVNKGIDADRMVLKSFGKSIPAAPNTTSDNQDNPKGRALNRRAEIIIKAYTK